MRVTGRASLPEVCFFRGLAGHGFVVGVEVGVVVDFESGWVEGSCDLFLGVSSILENQEESSD